MSSIQKISVGGVAILAAFAATATVRAPAASAATPPCGAVLMYGSRWLGGAGVDVHSNGQWQASTTGNSCGNPQFSTSNPAVQDGYAWQCVELAARLYAVKGWGNVHAGGNGGAKYIPEGSPSLTFHANGTGYVPVPGDLVIYNNATYGHVSVVNNVSGSTIDVVEQNASWSAQSSLSMSGSGDTIAGSVRGVEHSPKNTNTNGGGGTTGPKHPSTDWLIGDVNGDGKADLTHLWSGGVNTLLSNGNGTYSLASEGWLPRAGYNMGIGSTDWLIGDVNGDGKADLTHLWSGGVNTLLSNGNGTYSLASEGWLPRAGYNMGIGSTDWLIGDVNGDGKADLTHLWSGGVNTLLSNGNGTYSLASEGWLPRAGYNMGIGSTDWLIGDVNGDGKADLTHLWSGGVNTLLSNGNGTYSLASEGWLPRAGYNMGIGSTDWLIGDVNGDGKADLTHLWSGGVNTLLSNGNGTYSLASEGWLPRAGYNMGIGSTDWLIGDVNGDGKADLTHLWSGGVNTLLSNGNGTYSLASEGWLPRAGYNMGINGYYPIPSGAWTQ